MAFDKAIEKLDRYYARLKKKKAKEVKAAHVEKVLRKIAKREKELAEKIAATTNEDRRKRFERKLRVAKEQRKRAEWLLEQIDS